MLYMSDKLIALNVYKLTIKIRCKLYQKNLGYLKSQFYSHSELVSESRDELKFTS